MVRRAMSTHVRMYKQPCKSRAGHSRPVPLLLLSGSWSPRPPHRFDYVQNPPNLASSHRSRLSFLHQHHLQPPLHRSFPTPLFALSTRSILHQNQPSLLHALSSSIEWGCKVRTMTDARGVCRSFRKRRIKTSQPENNKSNNNKQGGIKLQANADSKGEGACMQKRPENSWLKPKMPKPETTMRA